MTDYELVKSGEADNCPRCGTGTIYDNRNEVCDRCSDELTKQYQCRECQRGIPQQIDGIEETETMSLAVREAA